MAPDVSSKLANRGLPIGAEVQPDGTTHFRVWAPRRNRAELVIWAVEGAPQKRVELSRDENGYFAGFAEAVAGAHYAFRLDDDITLYPDPASRSQPEGPHGPSEVVDPRSYHWQDQDWRGVSIDGQVLYEMHVGTFTKAGTWNAATKQLEHLADLGVTVIEMMPVAEFAGNFGWGYDGVNLFAPTRLYGSPDDLRRFVDQAHRLGLGVILDVVYNHFGPSGNYIGKFSPDFVSRRHHTDWGEAINFDGENSAPVREFFLANAGYWIGEFHFDGLRLDAVHAILDDSPDHILAAIVRQVRATAGHRQTIVMAENEQQDARLLRTAANHGYGLDAAFNDDFHHAARVAMTGRSEGYYGDYHGTPQELISALKWGHLYQGQWNTRQSRQRGTPGLELAAAQFVVFLQNHDQVGNSPGGRRAHQLTSPGRHRAFTALMLLAPGTPLLFQGQEFSATTPFLYFADHEAELGKLVREGRHKELRQFRSLTGDDAADHQVDPCDRQTFERSKLDHTERDRNPEAYALHEDLLRLRRVDPVFSAQRSDRVHGSVLGTEAFLLRYFGDEGDDRLILTNLGRDLDLRPITEPLLAPPSETEWHALWSSEDPKYGGSGTFALDTRNWHLPGHATLVLGCKEIA